MTENLKLDVKITEIHWKAPEALSYKITINDFVTETFLFTPTESEATEKFFEFIKALLKETEEFVKSKFSAE